MWQLYTHAELTRKLESAQREIIRLRSLPDRAEEMRALKEENEKLRDELDSILIQRDNLWECLKIRHIKDGLL